MGNKISELTQSAPPPPIPEAPRYSMPDFNNIFHSGLPKMMQVTDDVHRLTNYMMDLRNMMIGMGILSIIGIFLFCLLKWHNNRQRRQRRRIEEDRHYSSLNRPFHSYPQKAIGDIKMDMDKLIDSSDSPKFIRTPPPSPKTKFGRPVQVRVSSFD